MLKDFFVSFKENFRQKTTNPFFGTLIVVWIVRNWQAIYSLFTFEDNKTLAQRIWILQSYFQPEGFFINLLFCITISIVVLIISYLLLNLSRLIINFYEKKITPWVYQVTDKNSVVLKTDYQKLQKEIENLEKRLEQEREERIKVQNERDSLYQKNISQPVQNNTSKNEEFEYEKDYIDRILKRITTNELNYNFESLISAVAQGTEIAPKDVNEFAKLSLVESSGAGYNFNKYKFTKLGEFVKKEYLRKHT
jgi:hypothetical protein